MWPVTEWLNVKALAVTTYVAMHGSLFHFIVDFFFFKEEGIHISCRAVASEALLQEVRVSACLQHREAMRLHIRATSLHYDDTKFHDEESKVGVLLALVSFSPGASPSCGTSSFISCLLLSKARIESKRAHEVLNFTFWDKPSFEIASEMILELQ